MIQDVPDENSKKKIKKGFVCGNCGGGGVVDIGYGNTPIIVDCMECNLNYKRVPNKKKRK